MHPRPAPRPARPLGPRLWPIALAVLLTACASVPDPAATEMRREVPPQWSAGAAREDRSATDLSTWWQRFDDPALAALVTQALDANTSVMSAQAALRQARALAEVARAGLGLSASVSGSAQRSRTDSSGTSNAFKASVGASWEPDLFGGNRAAANASETDAQASAASLSSVQVSLAAEVASSYINLRGLQARLAIARSNLATQTETLQITRWRAQAGLVSSLDVEQAVSAAEQTQAQLLWVHYGDALYFAQMGALPAARLSTDRALSIAPQSKELLGLRRALLELPDDSRTPLDVRSFRVGL